MLSQLSSDNFCLNINWMLGQLKLSQRKLVQINNIVHWVLHYTVICIELQCDVGIKLHSDYC